MGVQATFVLPWVHSEIDGLSQADVSALVVGANFRLLAPALHLFGRGSEPQPEVGERSRAARSIERLIGFSQSPNPLPAAEAADLPNDAFEICDGREVHIARLLKGDSGLLIGFSGQPPVVGRDYWVARARIAPEPAQTAHEAGKGVICFAAGTHLRTPFGSKPIEAFQLGDLIQTKDNGVKPVLWAGQRHLSGARLHVMPHLRPIRFRSGALGHGRPDKELIVSPQHRMLVKGAVALALYGSDELLVTAHDLLDGKGVSIASDLREVTYHHLLLEQHEIVFANGLETESFHPALADIGTLSLKDRSNLLQLMPHIGKNPEFYGQVVRRSLNGAEAAILGHRRLA